MLRLGPGRWLNAQLQLLSWLGEDLHGDSFLAEQRPQGRPLLIRLMHADVCRTSAYHERFRRTAERAMALSHRHMPALRAFGFLSAPVEAAAVIAPGTPGGRPPRPGAHGPGSMLTPASALTPPPPSGQPFVPSNVIPWLATDPVQGTELRTLLSGGLSPLSLGRILVPIADLLDRAAALSLCHGELSPSDILLCDATEGDGATPREGRPVLMDLGLAKVIADNPLDVPTPHELFWYRSPEQCQSGLRAQPASDRYALAAILYEGVAGRPPFLSPSATQLLHAHRSAPVPPLRSVLGGGKDRGRPPWFDRAQALDAFFVRALAKDPEARFPSAAAMMDEFLVALGESSAGALPARRRSPRWYRLSRPGSSAACDVVVGPRAVLGKQPGCDVVCQALPSPEHDAITGRISREHAVLIWLDDRLSVLDQSKSGTYVNGRRAGPRLCAVPPGALLRLGESLILQVELLSAETAGVPGLVLRRMDEYAAGVPPTLLLWGRAPAAATPLAELGGEFSGGHLSVAQGGLWYSSHPGVNWRRRDGTVVLGAAPLRADDVLADSAGTVVVER